MNKPTIFFSHSSKDKDLILPIKNKLTDITSGTMDIFMSSDGQSIPFGRNWVSKIEEGLENAQIMFVFVTPNSIKSEWIYFEAGYTYSKGIEVIPVGIGVHIGELKAPLNLLQGFDILSYSSMNNFISIINKRFLLSFREEFDESDYSLICKEIHKDKLDIEILDIIGTCRCEYLIHADDCVKSDFYNKVTFYLKNRSIKYSHSGYELLTKGIKVCSAWSTKDENNTVYSCTKFQLSSINIRENIQLLVDLMKFLKENYLSLYIGLENKFCCTYKDENISSMIYRIDDLTLNTDKVGVYNYKDIEWKTIKTLDREYEIFIRFKIDKVDFDIIIDFLKCLYWAGIIQKIDDEQLDL